MARRDGTLIPCVMLATSVRPLTKFCVGLFSCSEYTSTWPPLAPPEFATNRYGVCQSRPFGLLSATGGMPLLPPLQLMGTLALPEPMLPLPLDTTQLTALFDGVAVML